MVIGDEQHCVRYELPFTIGVSVLKKHFTAVGGAGANLNCFVHFVS